MAKDLRSFLKDRTSRHPEDLLVVDRPISVDCEVTALQRKLGDLGKYPIMLVERPIRADGAPSDYRLIINMLASRDVCAEAVGMHPRRVAMEYTTRQEQRIEPVVIDRRDTPVKEVVETGEDCDVLKFPIPVHHAGDVGPYITAGFCITAEPETRVQNSAIQRIWAKAPRLLSYFPHQRSHGWFDIAKYWAQGKPAPVAVWIGHHPAALIGSQTLFRNG